MIFSSKTNQLIGCFTEIKKRIFAENDPIVDKLGKELKIVQDKIEKMTKNLQDIVATLDTITAGVRLASSLIILGSSFA